MNYSKSINIDLMKVSDRVKHARESADMSKADLARACSVSKQAIGQIENGTTKSPNPTTLFSIAKATGFNAEWIATGNGPQKNIASGSGPLAKARQRVHPEATYPDDISNLMAVASPKTYKALEKLQEAYQSGKLNQEDLELLDAIARRLTNDKDGENS